MTDKTATNPAVTAAATPADSHAHFAGRDTMPIGLLAAVFGAVLILTWFLMIPTWKDDMNRYLSRKAQREGRYEDAVQPLLFLINKPSKNPSDATTVGSKNPTYLAELAHSYACIGDYRNSLKYYLLAQENRFTFAKTDQGEAREVPDFSRDIGLVYLKLEDLDQAEKYLLAYLAKNKIDPNGNFGMGELEMKRGNYIKAADYFKVVASDPLYEDKVRKYYAEIEEKLFAGIE